MRLARAAGSFGTLAGMTTPPILVACLCAGWCTTCEAYRSAFTQAAGELPAVHFVWVDIEDHSDALGDAALDIENFPTLLITRGGAPCFYGTVLPHAGTVVRMAEAAQQGELQPLDASHADAWSLAGGVDGLVGQLPREGAAGAAPSQSR